MDQRANSWLAFTLWCAVGAGLCVGVLSILTVGFAVLLVTFVIIAPNGIVGMVQNLWRKVRS